MTTIYKALEPQPEIEADCLKTCVWFSIKDSEEYDGGLRIEKPYKPGDEIDCPMVIHDPSVTRKTHRDFPTKRVVYKTGIVKSIRPVNKDGRWQWEIEVE